jgi:hypothetical protein
MTYKVHPKEHAHYADINGSSTVNNVNASSLKQTQKLYNFLKMGG